MSPHLGTVTPNATLSGRRWYGAAATVASVAVISFQLDGGVEAYTTSITGQAVYCLIVQFLLLMGAYRESLDAFHPICLTMIVMAILYPFHGLVVQHEAFATARLGFERYTFYRFALIAVMAASLAVVVGYRSTVAERLCTRPSRWRFRIDDQSPSLGGKLAFIWVISVAAKGLMFADGSAFHFQGASSETGAFKNVQFLLVTLGTLAPLAMLMTLGVGIRYGRRSWVRWAMAMLGVELVWGLVTGSKLNMVMPMVLFAMAYSRVRTQPFRLTHLAAAVVLFVTVVFPFSAALRAGYNSQLSTVQRSGLSAEILSAAVEDATDESAATTQDNVTVFAERMHGLTSLALIIKLTPEREPYQWGKPYLLLPMQITIPRFIWPDKPDMFEFAKRFREIYWQSERGNDTSFAPSQLGEFWSNFGFFGVLVGSLLFGFLLRFASDGVTLNADRHTVFRDAVAVMVVFGLVRSLESSLDVVMAATAKTLIVYLGIAWFLSVRTIRRPQKHS